MTSFSVCAFCMHRTDGDTLCDAFPDGIPNELFLGKVQHIKPVDGDGGIVFEIRDDLTPVDRDTLMRILEPMADPVAKRIRSPFRKTFTEADHPRADDGKFGVGGTATPHAAPASGEAAAKLAGTRAKSDTTDTKSKEFKSFFGDYDSDPDSASKVIDESGKPKLVYHGTSSGGFDKFSQAKDTGTNAYGPGIYFTDDPETAKGYQHEAEGTGNKEVKSVYLNIRKPFAIDDKTEISKDDHAAIIASASKANPDKGAEAESEAQRLLSRFRRIGSLTGEQMYDVLKEAEFSKKEISGILKDAGFDGITNPGHSGAKEWIAFSPDQIKIVGHGSPLEASKALEKSRAK